MSTSLMSIIRLYQSNIKNSISHICWLKHEIIELQSSCPIMPCKFSCRELYDILACIYDTIIKSRFKLRELSDSTKCIALASNILDNDDYAEDMRNISMIFVLSTITLTSHLLRRIIMTHKFVNIQTYILQFNHIKQFISDHHTVAVFKKYIESV